MNRVTHHHRLLVELVKSQKGRYIAAVVTLSLASLLAFLVPTIGKVVIDTVLTDTNDDSVINAMLLPLMGGAEFVAANLWIAAVAIAVVSLLSGVFMYFKDFYAASACEITAKNLRERLFAHLHKLPSKYHSKSDSGDILQRCTSDIDTLREFLTMQVMNIGRAIILLLIVVPLMLIQHVWMTVISMILVPIVLYSAWLFFEKIKQLFQEVDEAEGRLTTIVQENLTGIRVVRAFARQQHENAKFEEVNHTYSELNYKLICLLSNFWSLSDFICLIQTGLVLIGGGWLAAHGYITVGTYFAFITYTAMAIWPIRELGKELSEAGKATVAIGRIQEILNAEEEDTTSGAHLNDRLKGQITFNNVSFSYEPNRPVLKDVSFDVSAGDTIAIVGPTGSGKSTIMQLLMRLYDYEHGSILVDGKELSTIHRQSIREQVGSLQQEAFLFSRSLRENIKFSEPAASDSAMVMSSQAASVHHTIERFEQGYGTEIGERGVSLSGGQAQRVTLSRTLLKAPPILVLDDTLSAVDSATERKIIQALHEKKGEQTLLIITHRISVCQHADRVFVFEKGELTAQGTHEELAKQSGFYQELWNIQTGQQSEFEQTLDDTDSLITSTAV